MQYSQIMLRSQTPLHSAAILSIFYGTHPPTHLLPVIQFHQVTLCFMLADNKWFHCIGSGYFVIILWHTMTWPPHMGASVWSASFVYCPGILIEVISSLCFFNHWICCLFNTSTGFWVVYKGDTSGVSESELHVWFNGRWMYIKYFCCLTWDLKPTGLN